MLLWTVLGEMMKFLEVIYLGDGFLRSEVKWALGHITANKASGGNGIFAGKDGAVKVIHSVC